MKATLVRAVIGVLAAIVMTTVMDGSGLSAFSALPLFPLMLTLWYCERLDRRAVGFVGGRRRDYALAVLYPVVVLGGVTLVAFAGGAIDVSHTVWDKALRNLALITVATFLLAMITEEGFFRGSLWAALEKSGLGRGAVLGWTAVAFAAWHISAVSLHTGFDLPKEQIPIFLLNAAVLGAIWGMLRDLSGSVIVASLSHGIWNGGAYALFAFGSKVGALGVRNSAIYGPEAGIAGLALNVVVALILGWWWRSPRAGSTPRDRGPSSPRR